MTIQIIGMIGVTPPAGSAVHVIRGDVSRSYLRDFAKAHEDAGFDMVLVGYYAASAEGFNVAMYAAMQTERLKFLIAHRPGFVAPTLAARKIATFDQLTNGRICVHVIAGTSDQEQASEGDFLPKDQRYRRGEEYIGIIRRLWKQTDPFDHEGEFYKVRQAYSEVRPLQPSGPPLYFGGSSPAALEMGARCCDVFAMYGEPLKETSTRMQQFDAVAAKYGRRLGYNVSFRPIIADTEGAAWDKARKYLSDIESSGKPMLAPQNESAKRLVELAGLGEVYDERLWMSIASATGGQGNTSCLVGTPQQVGDAILNYYRLGVESFLIRGFEPLNDAAEFGRELIPYIKHGARAIDEQSKRGEVPRG